MICNKFLKKYILYYIQLLYTHVSATPNSHLLDNVRVEEREVDDQHRQESVNAAINILNSDINNRMHDINPTQQEDVDSIIMYVIQLSIYKYLS